MGIDTASALFLSAAKSVGVDFSNVMMVGRQHFRPSTDALARIFKACGIDENVAAFLTQHQYAEGFFEAMGARRVDSLDFSEYEGATFVHDLNLPLPGHLLGNYTLVYDGGTLEHVFNIAQALRNCMEMVRVGGCFVQVNNANNFMGHGFWQFSPETIFRAFSPTNGFEVKVVLLHEVVKNGRWASVVDPAVVQNRVWLTNSVPTYILTIAQRISDHPIFTAFPQQSDYEALWQDSSLIPSLRSKPPKPSLIKNPVARLRRLGRRLLGRPKDRLTPPFFHQITEKDVLLGRFKT